MIKLKDKKIFLGIYGWDAYLSVLKMMQLVYKHQDEIMKMLNASMQDVFWWTLERTDERLHKERQILSLPIRLDASGELYISAWDSDAFKTSADAEKEFLIRVHEAYKEAETDKDRLLMKKLKKSFKDEYDKWNTPFDPFKQEALSLLMQKHSEKLDDRETIEEIQKIMGKP